MTRLALKATGKPPSVLVREGWTWEEVFEAAAFGRIGEVEEAEMMNAMLGGR